MSVNKCIQTFEDLVGAAFKLRRFQNYGGLREIQLFFRNSAYESTSFENALKQTFTPDKVLFGSEEPPLPGRLKVAVTATSSSGEKAYLLSNYNTNHHSASHRNGLEYIRYRSRLPAHEVKVWEA